MVYTKFLAFCQKGPLSSPCSSSAFTPEKFSLPASANGVISCSIESVELVLDKEQGIGATISTICRSGAVDIPRVESQFSRLDVKRDCEKLEINPSCPEANNTSGNPIGNDQAIQGTPRNPSLPPNSGHAGNESNPNLRKALRELQTKGLQDRVINYSPQVHDGQSSSEGSGHEKA